MDPFEDDNNFQTNFTTPLLGKEDDQQHLEDSICTSNEAPEWSGQVNAPAPALLLVDKENVMIGTAGTAAAAAAAAIIGGDDIIEKDGNDKSSPRRPRTLVEPLMADAGPRSTNETERAWNKQEPGVVTAGDVLLLDNTEESTLLPPSPSTPPRDVSCEENWERGQVQPTKYRDFQFAIIFWIQFLSIAIYGIVGCVVRTHSTTTDSSSSSSTTDVILLEDVILGWGSILPLVFAICLTLLFLALITSKTIMEGLIVMNQMVMILSSFLVTMILFYQGLYFPGILATLSTACAIWYFVAIRNRIPFAAANLNCGLDAIRNNKGVVLMAMLHYVIFAIWLFLWCVSLSDVSDMQNVCEDEGESSNDCQLQVNRPGWIFPWVFSFFWTVQVLKYTVETIVAGVTATWYFTPREASSFCSSAVTSSMVRSWSTSFGSICFGALLVAIIQFLDWMVKNLRMRRNRNDGNDGGRQGQGGAVVEALLLCCLDCILSLMEDIVEYFNKWSFIYVGVYGYPYLTAGKKVMTLFQQRGWTVVIHDNLVSNTLGMIGFIMVTLSVVFSALIVGANNASFLMVGTGIALVFIAVFIYVLESAVNTVIVCFAESPADLGRNHLLHDREMRESWRKVYPTLRF